MDIQSTELPAAAALSAIFMSVVVGAGVAPQLRATAQPSPERCVTPVSGNTLGEMKKGYLIAATQLNAALNKNPKAGYAPFETEPSNAAETLAQQIKDITTPYEKMVASGKIEASAWSDVRAAGNYAHSVRQHLCLNRPL